MTETGRRISASGRAEFDLIVVGGGIHGVCLTLEAARRGLRPLLLERGDFGGATSGNTLGILHGGFRYLQSLDLPRYFDSVAERRWFARNFPDLVRPLPFVLPMYGGGLRRPAFLRTGLELNEALSAGRNRGVPPSCHIPAGYLLNASATTERFPMVRPEDLLGAAVWYDLVMHSPQHVLLELLRWAQACGATALSGVEAVRLLSVDDRTTGVEAVNRATGSCVRFAAPAVVNCAGPWSAELARRFGSPVPDLFAPSMAFNLLLEHEPLAEAALAVTAGARGHTYFLLPREGRILAGTYHAPWQEERGSAQPSEAQIESMLQDLNRGLRGLRLERSHVVQVLSGLLPAREVGTAKTCSRERIVEHRRIGGPRGLYSVAGVKFTTARRVAERVLRKIYGGTGRDLGVRPEAQRPPIPAAIAERAGTPLSVGISPASSAR